MTTHSPRTVALFSQPVDMGTEEPEPHQLRDVAALDDVYERIRRPDDHVVRMINVNHQPRGMDNIRQRLGPGDIVVQTCRVRKNDEESRKRLPFSGTEFEAVLNKAHDLWIAWSSRRRITLTAAGASVLAPGHEKLADLSFSQWPSADYLRLGRKRTAGYVVFTRNLWPGGPDYLNVFGPSGPTTQGLAAAIRDRCGEQMNFASSELIVIEIWTRSAALPIVPKPTTSFLDYSNDWVMAWHRKGVVNYVLPKDAPHPAGGAEPRLDEGCQ